MEYLWSDWLKLLGWLRKSQMANRPGNLPDLLKPQVMCHSSAPFPSRENQVYLANFMAAWVQPSLRAGTCVAWKWVTTSLGQADKHSDVTTIEVNAVKVEFLLPPKTMKDLKTRRRWKRMLFNRKEKTGWGFFRKSFCSKLQTIQKKQQQQNDRPSVASWILAKWSGHENGFHLLPQESNWWQKGKCLHKASNYHLAIIKDW